MRTSEDVVVNAVGQELYEKFFRGYTRKQWDLDPSELDASVTARVPTRTNRDDRYFTDTFQAMPKHGYTRMFERMLDSPRIKVMLNCDYKEIVDEIAFREMVYTGPVDEFFDYRYGKLPYRSLEFRHETHDVEFFQEAPVVNYPNGQPYTRVTEFKYLTGQSHKKTGVVYEYPKAEGSPIIRYRVLKMPSYTGNTNCLRKRSRMFISSAGSRRTSTTTWTRSSHRRLTVYGKMEGLKRKDAVTNQLAPVVVYTNGNGKSNGVETLDTVS